MKNDRYIYNVSYQELEKELCAFEVKALFGVQINEKVFFSNKEIDPSTSPFIKNRIEIIYETESLENILELITKNDMIANGFLVKYVELESGDPHFKSGKDISKEVGLRIYGDPSFNFPKIKYGISCYKNRWYLGELVENNYLWRAHKKKPHSYSSALNANIAKVLINLAGQGDTTKKLIDPCCGVGTVILEGLFSGYDIKGWEINSRIAKASRLNVKHYNYETEITNGDIKDIKEDYDVAIVDLPYGNFSNFDLEKQLEIIRQAMRISKKLVLVSSKNIADKLLDEKLNILDYCKVYKTEKREFARYIWICEKNIHHL